ncbi:MAG TPA: hypothetical protein VKU82_01500, partial [Planctomycetaceae bacterium]|nr:hypothetical protein [Planctomycetaceae bacterium]
MKRKHAAVGIGVFFVLVLLAGGLALSLRYRPAFYQVALADQTPIEVRRQHADTFVRTALQLVDGIQHEDRWS